MIAGRPDPPEPGSEPRLRAIVGPTSSGKTEASIAVARAIGAEIVSLDATNVYRGMDVGTAKPTPGQRALVPHHLIDLADPREAVTVAWFQSTAQAAIVDIESRGATPLLVGGSGLHYRAVVDGFRFPGTDPATRRLLEAEGAAVGAQTLHARLAAFDPEAAARIEPPNIRRTVRALEVAAITGRPFSNHAGHLDRYPPGRVRVAGIDVPRSVLHRRIEERWVRVWPDVVEEARRLVAKGFHRFLTSARAIGYAEAIGVLEGSMLENEAVAVAIRRTKALARRQVAWFRRDPRIMWFPVAEPGAAAVVDDLVSYLRRGPGAGSTGTMEA